MTLKSWEAFRTERNRTLPAPHGWLSLTSFQWLPETVASLDLIPGVWQADESGATVTAQAPDGLILIAGNVPINGTISAKLAENESLNWLRIGSVVIELAVRGGSYAIRTRDSSAATLQSFDGVPTFSYNPSFALRGSFEPFDAPTQRAIASANPRVPASVELAGEVHFELAGEHYRLLAQDTGDGYLVNFKDSTNGTETAGWRFLNVSKLEDGGLDLDFNYALNWPSGFSAFGTCPQPVPENTLPVRIEAGEKLL